MKKYRLALIGCGRISYKHINAINRIENACLAAVCDIRKERAKAKGEENNVPWYIDYHEMLKNEDIDIVNILVESGKHTEVFMDIAKYKRHIIVEKPMALTLSNADDMIRISDENRIKLFVVKQNRFNAPVQLLRRALEEGRFGKLILGAARVRWHRDQAYYDQDYWRGTWKYDGGVFANQAAHHLDLLEWMIGDVESVFAKSGTFLHNIETEDTGVAVMKFTNGALGTFEATTCTNPTDLEGSISILGENGTVEIGGFAVNEMKVWNFKDKKEYDKEAFNNSYIPKNVYGRGHEEYIKNVLNAIENNTIGLVEGIEGRRSLELINAIYESIETEKEIFLHFKPKKCKLGNSYEKNI
ncbi:MAG: Gfo/Idh/MocA family oxidoreductase [Candidatus Atribacteria bacterium]